MRKRRKRDIKFEDVVTEEDKLQYSRMMMRRWEEAAESGKPSAILDAERFPLEDPTKPWMSPEYHVMVARRERERQRLLRRVK
jgi:hypothetical protein